MNERRTYSKRQLKRFEELRRRKVVKAWTKAAKAMDALEAKTRAKMLAYLENLP